MTRPFPPRVDVAIVGSGPTGAAYARILSELAPDATIALFEAGPVLADPPGLHVKNIEDVDERLAAQRRSEGLRPHTATKEEDAYADPAERVMRPGTHLLPEGFQEPGEDGIPALAMSTNVGGMGAHWTCACPRPGGAERIAFLPDLDELLDEAERLLAVDRHPFDDAPYADVVRDRLAAEFDPGRPEERRVRAMPLAVHRRPPTARLRGADPDVVFGDVTRGNPNFTLFAEAPARRVLVEHGRAVGVVVRDLTDGTEHEVRARFVVVAADALRTPQVLFASGVRPKALGRYLNDQPQIVFAVRLTDVAHTAAEQHDPRGDSTITEQSGVQWVPYTDADPFHGQVMQLDASPIPLVGDDVPGAGQHRRAGLVLCEGPPGVRPGRVLRRPRPTTTGCPSRGSTTASPSATTARSRRSREAILRAARSLGEFIGDAPLMLSGGASLHYQGTTRMGLHDDGTSVCGPTSEVWGVSGLYVAGNNVIPTPIACNPTLTSVALAVGGARDISARLAAGSGVVLAAASEGK